jgi:hypothetical protein
MFQKLAVIVIVLGFVLLGYAGNDVDASYEWSTEATNLLMTTTQQKDTPYPVVDTGQAACYDDSGAEITCPAKGEAFYGQDAQFSGNVFSFTDNGDGTVTDNVTGLI